MTGDRNVVILQEYVPNYRVPFFEALTRKAKEEGIVVHVGHGRPGPGQAGRGDAAELDNGILIKQRELSIAGRRVVLRRLPTEAKCADLLILEQARRNLDTYRLFIPRWRRHPRQIGLWGHGRDYTKTTSATDSFVQRMLTRRADWFFGYTLKGVQHVVHQGIDPSRATVVQNSTDTVSLLNEIGGLDAKERETFQSRHQLAGRTALYIGALDDSKLIPLLITAADLLSEVDSTFRLLIGGDGPLRSSVQAAASTNAQIVYLGVLDGAAKALAMSCSEVLTIPGRVGLVAVDSIAVGVPIVTTDWELHAPEYEYLDESTHVAVTQDPHAYADAIKTLLDDEKLQHDMRRRLVARRDEFTIDAMAGNFLRGIVGALEASP